MAQDFERAVAADGSGDVAIGTTPRTIITANSDDALIGIRLTNIVTQTIQADVYSNNVHGNTGGILVFDLPDLIIKAIKKFV